MECGDLIMDNTIKTNDVEEAADDPEPVEPKSCCRCNQVVEELFDVDSCPHNVCVSCRFKDEVPCVACPPEREGSSKITEKSKSVSNLYSMFFQRRRVVNKDHIIDVELSTGDSTVDKQMCTVCQRVFKKTNARYHYSCASGDKPFTCTECGQKFVKKSHMEAHMFNHLGIKPFKCTQAKCKSSFTQKDKLIRHLKTHNKDVKFVCAVCDKPYATQDILNYHMSVAHSSIKSFQCDLCPRSYKYSKNLRGHRLKHHATRNHMCEVCGKKYALISHLREHKRSHVLYHRRPFKCGCGRRFMSQRDKARHSLIHTSSRDFECSLCNTTFGRKDNLERHMKNFHQDDTLGKTGKLVATVAPFNKNPSLEVTENVKTKTDKFKKLETSLKPKDKPKCTINKKVRFGKTKCLKKSKEKRDQAVQETSSNQEEKLVSNKNTKLEPYQNNTQSVIVSPKTAENNQNRPSVIKNIPNLLPYKVLPPDKRFLKMTEDIAKGKKITELPFPVVNTNKTTVNLLNISATSSNKNYHNSTNTLLNPKNSISSIKNTNEKTQTHTQKRRIPKEEAFNRCYRIICHTSAVEVEHVPVRDFPQEIENKLETDLKAVISGSSLRTGATIRDSCRKPKNTSFVSPTDTVSSRTVEEINEYINKVESMTSAVSISSPANVGGPSLAAGLPENTSDMNDNFTNSYVSLGESSCSSYTPYFDNDYFRDSESSYDANVEYVIPNDLDIGFQYINEQLGCAEMNFSSESRIVRYVSQENRVVRDSLSQSF